MADEPKVIALPLSRARQLLIQEAQPFVRKMARSHARAPGIEYDELVGVGNVALVELARRYDGTADIPFVAFAFTRVRGAMLDAVAKVRKTQRRTAGPLPEQLLADLPGDPDPDANETEARDALDAAADALAAAAFLFDDARGLRDAVASLEASQRELVTMHYFDDVPLKDAAARLGLAYRTARRRHADALVALSKRVKRAD